MQFSFQEVTENKEKSRITRDVLSDLPMWFGIPSAVEEYVENVKNFLFIKADANDKAVGFASIKSNNSYTAEIYLIGIKSKFHRLKIGEQLLNHIFSRLEKENYSYIMVKTLDESAESKEYEKTRLFYKKMGFIPLDVIPEIWEKQTPCLIMIRNL